MTLQHASDPQRVSELFTGKMLGHVDLVFSYIYMLGGDMKVKVEWRQSKIYLD